MDLDSNHSQERGRMMGLMGTIINIVNIPASWFGGYLYDNISPSLPFQMSFVIDIISLGIFIALFKEPDRSSTNMDVKQELSPM